MGTSTRTALERAKTVVKRSRVLHSCVKFSRMLPSTNPSLLIPLSRTRAVFQVLPNTMLSIRALVNVYDCAKIIEKDGVPGDIAECGVWAGGAVGLMHSASHRYGTIARTFHLFDSFEGLPQPSSLDVDVLDDFRKMHPKLDLDEGTEPSKLIPIGACAAPLDQVIELFDRVLKAKSSEYVIHQGWFQETIAAAVSSIEQLAILRLDGDWYESTLVCLNGLYDKLAVGGFLILDDYGFFQGCTRAVDEFLSSRGISPELLEIEPWGAFMRKRSKG